MAVSFAMWVIPGQSEELRGFAERSTVGAGGAFVLAGWYALCLVVIWACIKLGTKVRTIGRFAAFDHSPSLERSFFWFISIVASVGMVYCLVHIALNVSIIDAIQNQTFNNLAHALPEGTGISTLRYATALAAPVGVYLWQRKNAPLPVVLWNVLLLLANVALASRLSLILALLVYVFLFVRTNRGFRLKWWVAVIAFFALFGGLTAFNYARNAGYYERHGVENAMEMNAYQLAAYLGTPIQVSLGVADQISTGKLAVAGDPFLSLQAIAPTFVDFEKVNLGTGTKDERYGSVSVADNLTTNSAFADTYVRYGWWGATYTLLVLALAAFGFGVFARYRSVVSIFAAVLLYGFAEYWRIFLFNQGILVFLLLVTAAGLIVSLAVKAALDRWPQYRVRPFTLKRRETRGTRARTVQSAGGDSRPPSLRRADTINPSDSADASERS
ncbi:hypothetical protein [Cryobacterium arcticum]|uniref:hypothetical protein n=1 Tax=Cryobacterium arcticum TaxID=670052 RepID=UPI0011B6C790|nr:hypothetical protein [Cryobacterium arcticum]